MKLAYAATMIRPCFPRNSIVAQVVSVPTFLHSLDPKQKLMTLDAYALAGRATISLIVSLNKNRGSTNSRPACAIYRSVFRSNAAPYIQRTHGAQSLIIKCLIGSFE